MTKSLDHIVVWVTSALDSVSFYENVVGLPGVRLDEFRAGRAPFPSVRISETSLIDIMPREKADDVDQLHGVPGSAGNLVNHLCLALDRESFSALRSRLAENGVEVLATMTNTFGAQGMAAEAVYFPDPDGNVIEARTYA
jgi:catechol 2,3-dioxygenase-like lactoylglutathione lyase family enzyme